MDIRVVHQAAVRGRRADENRQTLRQAGVFTANFIGTAGCGKTTLIGETVGRLIPVFHMGVIACDPEKVRDASRMADRCDQIVQVDTGEGQLLEASDIQEALRSLDLGRLEMLLIENISSIVGPAEVDLGEDAKVAVFSVTEGDDKADKYADVVGRADAVILNKLDLADDVTFNLDVFRSDVRRLNPGAALFEMSLLKGQGMERWLHWLMVRSNKRPENLGHISHWFG